MGVDHDHLTGDAVSATDEQSAAALDILNKNELKVFKALRTLRIDNEKSYARALQSLGNEDRKKWMEVVGDFEFHGDQLEVFQETADCLKIFIETEILPKYQDRRHELEHRLLIREQSFGEAAYTPALAGLARYEVHLDRKLERILAMLLKLQSLRRDDSAN
jgi:hypothetical protein